MIPSDCRVGKTASRSYVLPGELHGIDYDEGVQRNSLEGLTPAPDIANDVSRTTCNLD